MGGDPRDADIARLRAEVARLRGALIACGRSAGGAMADDVSTDFLMHVPDEVRLKLARQAKEIEGLRAFALQIAHTNPGMLDMQRAAELAVFWIADAARALEPKT